MMFNLRHSAVLVLGVVGVALSGAPSSANPHHGYGHHHRPYQDYGYYHRPYPTPRGHGEVVILQPPARYAPPPAYYAPPPGYYAPVPYQRYGYYGRPGVSLNFGF